MINDVVGAAGQVVWHLSAMLIMLTAEIKGSH